MNARTKLIWGISLALALAVVPAGASITFSAAGSGALSNLSASAEFEISGSNLIITLTNTATSPALEPADILTAFFFSLNGVTLTPVSAVLGGSSVVLYDDAPVGGVVGGEWAYESGIAAPGGADQGISSTGLSGLFGASSDYFPGDNLDGEANVGGMAYGIVPASGTTGGNTPVTGPNPFIQDSVIFTLSFTGDLSLDDISDVSFQYGTSPSEPNLSVVPEPASLSLLGIGIAFMAVRRGMKKRSTM
ncbi:MAG: PEP-CTERM sorting domain-containing protein [Candidatus Hydrogenedentes bacterium]|nr:PEP-CTERM sorting domain-containing protein [Candidatus Hydrogenedentota bacterium]